MWKWGSITLASIFIFNLIFFYYHQNRTEKEGGESQEVESGVEQFLSDTHLIKSRGSKKLWELKANEVYKEKNSEEWRLDQVEARLFGENQVIYKVTGMTGFFDNEQKYLKIDGNTRIFSSNGYIMDTSTIHYQAKTHSVIGPGPVELQGFFEEEEDDANEQQEEREEGKGSSLFVKGDLFEAHLETNIINLRKNIQGKKKMSGNRSMKITSKEAVFNGQTKDVLFKGSVVVTIKPLVITGPQARFKYENNRLHSLFMDGTVKINDMKRWGQAGEVEIFFKEDKYVLRKDPKVTQANDHVIGEEIIFLDGGNRIRVKKARTRYNYNTETKENPHF